MSQTEVRFLYTPQIKNEYIAMDKEIRQELKEGIISEQDIKKIIEATNDIQKEEESAGYKKDVDFGKMKEIVRVFIGCDYSTATIAINALLFALPVSDICSVRVMCEKNIKAKALMIALQMKNKNGRTKSKS